MLEQTFHMKVITQVVLWFSIKYLYIFSYAFFSLTGLWVFVTTGFCWGKLAFIFTIGLDAALLLIKILLKCLLVFNWQTYLSGQSR